MTHRILFPALAPFLTCTTGDDEDDRDLDLPPVFTLGKAFVALVELDIVLVGMWSKGAETDVPASGASAASAVPFDSEEINCSTVPKRTSRPSTMASIWPVSRTL